MIVFALMGFGAVAQTDQSGINTSHQKGCCDFPIPIMQADLSPNDLIEKQFQIETFYENGIQKFKLRFRNTQTFRTVLQSYTNYIQSVFGCVNAVGLVFNVSDVEGLVGIPNNSRIARSNFPVFRPTNSNSVIDISSAQGLNFFNEYYSTRTDENSGTASWSTDNELVFNRKYVIGVGIWIDGCREVKGLTCATASSFRTFRVSTPALQKGQVLKEVTIEEFDTKGKTVKTYKMPISNKN